MFWPRLRPGGPLIGQRSGPFTPLGAVVAQRIPTS